MYQCEPPEEDCISFLFLGRAYQGAPNEIVFRDYCEDSLSKKQIITQLITEIDSNPLRFRAKIFKDSLTQEQLDQFHVFCGPKVGIKNFIIGFFLSQIFRPWNSWRTSCWSKPESINTVYSCTENETSHMKININICDIVGSQGRGI